MAPMLVLLSGLSLTRPVGWTVASYLQACQLPRRIFGLEAFKLACLVLCIVAAGKAGPVWACAAVGVAFGAHALASLWVVRAIDGVPLSRTLASLAPALAACLVMVAAVLGVRSALGGALAGRPWLALGVEVGVGASTYLLAALLLARRHSHELVSKLRDALRPRVAG
jgi:PST family polysaccharide transporter